MRVLIACDKFKNTMTAQQVCSTISDVISAAGFECIACPLGDGGDGTAEILTLHTQGKLLSVDVNDPFFRIIKSSYGISGDGKTAFIEMANASGLKAIKPEEYNVMKATTLGTGELIYDALEHGCNMIVLGIGGSATNDGGMGMAAALGFEFHDERGNRLEPIGENLISIDAILETNVHPGLRNTTIVALCDVDNPLYGDHGAAFVYAPQKGATPQHVRMLDDGLVNLSEKIKSTFGIDVSTIKGAGAGGGIGGGAIAFLGATLRRGSEVVFEYADFSDKVSKCDVVITGEGKIDQQTLHGKLVCSVAAEAKKQDKKVLAVAGVNELSNHNLLTMGIEQCWSLSEFISPAEAVGNPIHSLAKLTSEQIVPWLKQV